jgi:hypothetical protein
MPAVHLWKVKVNDFNEKQISLIYTFININKPYELLYRSDISHVSQFKPKRELTFN